MHQFDINTCGEVPIEHVTKDDQIAQYSYLVDWNGNYKLEHL